MHDKITTGESSVVRILLGGKAVVTVRERSALTIHETRTTSTIEISSGKVALAVAKTLMKPGDSVQIKTPNAMAGVRGTMVVVDVTGPVQVGGSVTTRFTLLTGIVDVTHLDAGTRQPAGQPLTLHPLQTITVTGHTPPGAATAISRAEAQKIASEYEVSLPTPPPTSNREVMERQIAQAAKEVEALARTLARGEQGPSSATQGTDGGSSGSGSGSSGSGISGSGISGKSGSGGSGSSGSGRRR